MKMSRDELEQAFRESFSREFSEIPAGFALTDRVSTPIIISKTYGNANGDRIILDQSIAADGDTFFFDNENGQDGRRWSGHAVYCFANMMVYWRRCGRKAAICSKFITTAR